MSWTCLNRCSSKPSKLKTAGRGLFQKDSLTDGGQLYNFFMSVRNPAKGQPLGGSKCDGTIGLSRRIVPRAPSKYDSSGQRQAAVRLLDPNEIRVVIVKPALRRLVKPV